MLSLTSTRHISTLREAVTALWATETSVRSRATQTLTLSVALDLGMNLAPVRVEHAHGDGARRPVYVGDKPDGANSVSRIGEQFTNDAGRTVEKLDAKLHGLESSDATSRQSGPLNKLSAG